MRLSFFNWLMRGFNDFTSEIDRQIDRQASIPPVAGLVLAMSAAAGGIIIHRKSSIRSRPNRGRTL